MKLGEIQGYVMLLVLTGLILGAGVLALESMRGGYLVGPIGGSNTSNAFNAINNATGAITNLSQQIPVVGTLIGVSVIIVVVLMAFSFGGRSKR
jgi:hypothetical protein